MTVYESEPVTYIWSVQQQVVKVYELDVNLNQSLYEKIKVWLKTIVFKCVTSAGKHW